MCGEVTISSTLAPRTSSISISARTSRDSRHPNHYVCISQNLLKIDQTIEECVSFFPHTRSARTADRSNDEDAEANDSRGRECALQRTMKQQVFRCQGRWVWSADLSIEHWPRSSSHRLPASVSPVTNVRCSENHAPTCVVFTGGEADVYLMLVLLAVDAQQNQPPRDPAGVGDIGCRIDRMTSFRPVHSCVSSGCPRSHSRTPLDQPIALLSPAMVTSHPRRCQRNVINA